MKKEVLTRRNTLLSQIKCCIDKNLNPAKVKVIDPTKDNFDELILNELKTLDELSISNSYYYWALSVSKNEDLELHFFKNLIPVLLIIILILVWKLWTYRLFLMSIRLTYVRQCFTETEDWCWQVVRQAVKEAFKNNMYHQHNENNC